MVLEKIGGGFIINVGLNDKRKHNRINYLKRKYDVLYSKGEYNKNKYKRFVYAVSKEYMMTRWQRQQTKYVIDNTDFRTLERGNQHNSISWKAIVTAICFYFMRKDGRPLTYSSKFLQTIGLNKATYDCIAKKLNGGYDSQSMDNTYYIVEKT